MQVCYNKKMPKKNKRKYEAPVALDLSGGTARGQVTPSPTSCGTGQAPDQPQGWCLQGPAPSSGRCSFGLFPSSGGCTVGATPQGLCTAGSVAN